MSFEQKHQTGSIQEPPWYRQFWPWFIIALPASAVIASLITFYLAVSRPDHLVVEDEEYQRLNSELKAQPAVQESEQDKDDKSDSSSN
ncbi:MAG: hypothetical protein GQ538_01535 [Xanthomonadales bacterium]|nr:hypothetical protein [Xanthomonadales bacterium]